MNGTRSTQSAEIIDGRRIALTDVALPPSGLSFGQDKEWCVVRVGESWKKIRFHDYGRIYEIPGLYEVLFRDVLKCMSPAKIRGMLQQCCKEEGIAPRHLRVLDLGAGNGMVGEELSAFGVNRIVGIDIVTSAAAAARRDNDGVYDDYRILDMTEIPEPDLERLRAYEFNCLTCVAALGFADIPPAAFANAFNLVGDGGWIAFNIKSEFLGEADASGFARLIRRMIDDETISVRARHRYTHRLATNGKPLLYTAFVCRKNRVLTGELPS